MQCGRDVHSPAPPLRAIHPLLSPLRLLLSISVLMADRLYRVPVTMAPFRSKARCCWRGAATGWRPAGPNRQLAFC